LCRCAKATADAERLILRAASVLTDDDKKESGESIVGNLETYVVCPGVLYGAGEFPDGFLAPMRAAWEGKPVPVFGSGRVGYHFSLTLLCTGQNTNR
jgi:hypothetical protein